MRSDQITRIELDVVSMDRFEYRGTLIVPDDRPTLLELKRRFPDAKYKDDYNWHGVHRVPKGLEHYRAIGYLVDQSDYHLIEHDP
mgnify:CR=1 FL=1